VEGEDLAWPDQVMGSFVFSPLHCGYDPVATDGLAGTGPAGGYRETHQYAYRTGGVYLGNAMAISGTPVYPRGTFHSSRALASLLTIFNIRLGWWLGNPAGTRWREDGPRQGLLYLLGELFGRTRTGSQFVYLCDGGQFDNLGIYELVRWRCRLIVACDATADPTMSFQDLGNAIRKCRIDFGCDIEIDASPLRAQGDSGVSTWHCAIGRIHYDKADRESTGTLIYIRPSLTDDEPTDLRDLDVCSWDAAGRWPLMPPGAPLLVRIGFRTAPGAPLRQAREPVQLSLLSVEPGVALRAELRRIGELPLDAADRLLLAAGLAAQSGLTADAIEDYERALELAELPAARASLGDLYLSIGLTNLAERQYRKVVPGAAVADPAAAAAELGLGCVDYLGTRFGEAAAHFERARRLYARLGLAEEQDAAQALLDAVAPASPP
jgi:hypothetical protein